MLGERTKFHRLTAFDPKARQDARRRVRQPRKLFAIDKLAAKDCGLKPLGLNDHGGGLAHKRALRFGEPRCAAEVIGKAHGEVAITARVSRPAVDVRE